MVNPKDSTREELTQALTEFFTRIKDIAPEYCKANYSKVGGSFNITIPKTAKGEVFGDKSADNVIRELKEKNTEFYTYAFSNGELSFFVTAFNRIKLNKKSESGSYK